MGWRAAHAGRERGGRPGLGLGPRRKEGGREREAGEELGQGKREPVRERGRGFWAGPREGVELVFSFPSFLFFSYS
jgi:hypothetical protein